MSPRTEVCFLSPVLFVSAFSSTGHALTDMSGVFIKFATLCCLLGRRKYQLCLNMDRFSRHTYQLVSWISDLQVWYFLRADKVFAPAVFTSLARHEAGTYML